MTFLSTLKSIARRTTPVLWAIPMGTGAISMLFFAFPYGQGSQVLAIFSLIFYFLNIGLFVLFNASTIARFTMDPRSFLRLLAHPSYCLFFGCYPMGATTILNVSLNVVYQYYGVGGKKFLYFLWVLWWINVAISAICFWGTTHLMITRHSHTLPAMTAAWILPVVTFVVASSTGALTAQYIHQYSVEGALVTVTVAAYLLTSGLFLAAMMLTVYILRLVIYGFPPGLSVLSVFLPLGVSAQAGYSVTIIGAEFRTLLPLASSNSPFFVISSSGDAIYSFACITGFLLWAWAVLWIAYALLGLVHILRRGRIEFKLTAWGLVFPNGVFSNLTIHLAQVFDSGFFRVVGAIYSILTFLLWCYISYNSLLMVPKLFHPQAVDEGKVEGEKNNRFGDDTPTATGSPPTSFPSASRTLSIESGQLAQTLRDEDILVE